MKTIHYIAIVGAAVAIAGLIIVLFRTLVPVPITEVMTFDGCEYISSPVHGGRTLTHKGNCTNSVHQK